MSTHPKYSLSTEKAQAPASGILFNLSYPLDRIRIHRDKGHVIKAVTYLLYRQKQLSLLVPHVFFSQRLHQFLTALLNNITT